MHKNLIIIIIASIWHFIGFSQTALYPFIPSIKVSDTYFDTTITDAYRNLEDINSVETKTWITQQNEYSRDLLKKYRIRENAINYIKEFKNYSYRLPYKVGSKYYFNHNENLYSYSNYNDMERDYKVVCHFDKLSLSNDNINVKNCVPSLDTKHIAVVYSRNGADWEEIKVTKSNGKLTDDHLVDLKFSTPCWKNDGFFYIKYLRREQFSSDTLPQIYYHKVGTLQSADLLIDAYNSKYGISIDFQVTSDERYLFVYKTHKANAELSSVFYIDLNTPDWRLRPFVERVDNNFKILNTHQDYLLAITTMAHPNGCVVKLYAKEPYKWIPVTKPFEDAGLANATVFDDMIVCEVSQGPTNFFALYKHSGVHIVNISTPLGYSIGGFNGNKSDKEAFFYIENYFVPRVVYKMDLKTYYMGIFEDTEVSFDITKYTYELKEYTSKDGTKIPLSIVYKKGTKLDGNNPTLLKSYGGFGHIERAEYDPALVYFLSKGGVFAYAHVRGEGTYGNRWADLGKNLNKQNTFDDFIAAAEYLIKEKYTSSQKLAISGGSHGGMLVGAAMVQRPELFKLVIPQVGVFDMLRKEKFTVGAFNVKEYGTVKKQDEFKNLLSYSPYHNIKQGVNYPMCLVTTSENDERVPPFHSYKFVAKLQNNPGQKNPILMSVSTKAGHNGGSYLEEQSDFYALLLQILD